MNEALDLLQRLAGSTDAHFYVKDGHCCSLYGNAAVARTLATAPEAIVGQPDADFVDETAARPFREADHRVLATGQPETLHTRLMIDGRAVLFEDRKVPLALGEGRMGVAGIAFITPCLDAKPSSRQPAAGKLSHCLA